FTIDPGHDRLSLLQFGVRTLEDIGVEAHEVRNIPFQETAADRLLAQKSSALHGVEAKRGSSIYSRLSTLYTDGQSTSGHHPPNGEHWIWRSHITVASGR